MPYVILWMFICLSIVACDKNDQTLTLNVTYTYACCGHFQTADNTILTHETSHGYQFTSSGLDAVNFSNFVAEGIEEGEQFRLEFNFANYASPCTEDCEPLSVPIEIISLQKVD